MPKRSGTPPKDLNHAAHRVIQTIAEKHEKDPAAVELGRRGGLKGGAARAKKMTKQERSASAKKAADARWKKTGK